RFLAVPRPGRRVGVAAIGCRPGFEAERHDVGVALLAATGDRARGGVEQNPRRVRGGEEPQNPRRAEDGAPGDRVGGDGVEADVQGMRYDVLTVAAPFEALTAGPRGPRGPPPPPRPPRPPPPPRP